MIKSLTTTFGIAYLISALALYAIDFTTLQNLIGSTICAALITLFMWAYYPLKEKD